MIQGASPYSCPYLGLFSCQLGPQESVWQKYHEEDGLCCDPVEPEPSEACPQEKGGAGWGKDRDILCFYRSREDLYSVILRICLQDQRLEAQVNPCTRKGIKAGSRRSSRPGWKRHPQGRGCSWIGDSSPGGSGHNAQVSTRNLVVFCDAWLLRAQYFTLSLYKRL